MYHAHETSMGSKEVILPENISFKSKTSFQAKKKKINPAIKQTQNAFIHKGISSLQKQADKI